MMTLAEQTTRLLAICDECEQRFYYMRETDQTPDFFADVKPYADDCHALLDDWAQGMNDWIRKDKPGYVHPPQIESSKDMMAQFVVQSFYKETGKKRFILSINAVRYTLKTALDAMEGAADEKA